MGGKGNRLKALIFSVITTTNIVSSVAQVSDSLQLAKELFHAALNSNENGCYEIKIYAKPLTQRDTSERVSIVKFYPSSSKAPQDSVRNFYYRCGFEPWGHLHHDSTNIWYNSDWKQLRIMEWEPTFFAKWLEHKSWYLYPPLFRKDNVLSIKHHELEKYAISHDSLYYYGKSYNIEDTLTETYSIEISYQPRLHIKVTEDFIGPDQLSSQYTRYEVVEIESDTIAHVPKKLSSNYLGLMPGYSWKPIEEKKDYVPKVKENITAIPWKGLLLNGDTLSSSDIKERFVVLDFWYKSCGPCWASIRDLSKYNSGLTEDVYILGVNVADWKVKEDAVTIFKRQGGNYQVLFDTDDQIRKEYEVVGYPTIFVIDRERNEIIFHQKGHPDDLIEKIEAAIKKAKGS